MREELVESVFNIIKDLDSLAQIKRVFKGNDIDIDSSLGKELVDKWKAAKGKEEASAPVYPAKSLNIETKVVDTSEAEKVVEDTAEEVEEEIEETEVEEPAPFVGTASPRIYKK